MAIAQQVELEGIPVIGLDLTISRGTKPSVARVRLSHNRPLDINPLTLRFRAGAQAVQLQKMVPDLASIRYENRPNNKREYRVLLRDRRVRWSTWPLTGDYNVRYRDGTVKPSTQKTVDELCDLALTESGESGSTSSGISGFYPRADWQTATVASGLDDLCAALPLHVCWKKDDTYAVYQTGFGDSITPTTLGGKAKIPSYVASLTKGPQHLTLVCGPTWFEAPLELEAVGLDTNGRWLLIDELSYKPASGWENEWPTLFTGVAQEHRHLALRTVFRCYRVKVQPVTGATVTVTDPQQFLLDDHKVAMAGAGDDKWLRPASVRGTYYPWSDHFKNTGDCTPYPGDFRIDPELRIVWFDLPVFKAGSCVAPATLYLETGFHLIDPATQAPVRKEVPYPGVPNGEGEWVIYRPELWETSIVTGGVCTGGSATKNTTALTAEAAACLAAWMVHFMTVQNIRDVPVAGVWQVSTSGNIAQVSYRVGRGLMPETRASEHYEHKV